MPPVHPPPFGLSLIWFFEGIGSHFAFCNQREAHTALFEHMKAILNQREL